MPATNQQNYVILFAVMNGVLLTEMQDISRKLVSNAQNVSTIVKGFAGQSPGAPMVTFSVKNAVPQGNFEFNVDQYIVQLIPVKIQMWGPGGLKSTGQIWITDSTLEQGVSKQASYDFDCVGPGALFT